MIDTGLIIRLFLALSHVMASSKYVHSFLSLWHFQEELLGFENTRM